MKDGSTIVLFKDNTKEEVFLVFRSDFPIWVTTGGAIEDNESPQQAAIREAKEETGFEVEIKSYCGVYNFNNNQSFLFEGRVVSGEFRPEFKGCKGKWFPIHKLPKDITSRTKTKILDAATHTGKPFTKKGDPVKLRNNKTLAFRHPICLIKFIYHKLTNTFPNSKR